MVGNTNVSTLSNTSTNNSSIGEFIVARDGQYQYNPQFQQLHTMHLDQTTLNMLEAAADDTSSHDNQLAQSQIASINTLDKSVDSDDEQDVNPHKYKDTLKVMALQPLSHDDEVKEKKENTAKQQRIHV
eukprot:UN03759